MSEKCVHEWYYRIVDIVSWQFFCIRCGEKLSMDKFSDRATELEKNADALNTRIAELEAEVAELVPYRDGYDPEEVFPPEAEWVWMRDCDDNIEPVQYNHIAEIYWNYMPGDCDELYCYWHPNDGDLRRWYPIGKLPEGA